MFSWEDDMLTRSGKLFRFATVLLILVVGLAPAAVAKNISVKNNGSSALTLSDLAIYPQDKQKGTPQVILVANNAADDQALAAGQTRLFNTDMNNNPLGEWKSYEISWMVGTSEVEGLPVNCVVTKASGVQTAGFAPDQITTFSGAGSMYVSYSVGAPPLPEGQILNLVNGIDAGFPDFAFSSTPFTTDANCNLVGYTGINGTVTAGVTLEIAGLDQTPTTSVWGLLLLAGAIFVIAASLLVVRRRRPTT